MSIDITGIDKAQLLYALWKGSKEQGVSFLGRHEVDLDACRDRLKQSTYVDYFAGRVIKCDFSGDALEPWGYDRDLGEGATAFIVDSLRSPVSVRS